MATHNELGALGEDIATHYLLQKNYKILDRNWRWKKKELDIIALDQQYLVFVEVKTGNSRLSSKQRLIRNLVKDKKIRWAEVNDSIRASTAINSNSPMMTTIPHRTQEHE